MTGDRSTCNRVPIDAVGPDEAPRPFLRLGRGLR